MQKPLNKPICANFSSGPCTKRPNWRIDALDLSALGRSHRSTLGKKKLALVIELIKETLQLPKDYRVGILPASDTGAFEAALWSLLGVKGIDVFSWEAFGKGWLSDILNQLKLTDVREFDAPYGELPDLTKADKTRDIVFTYNGTTSGVCVPNTDWISEDRTGLTICDATSAVYAMPIDFKKLDVTTFSWQKALGGEGAHGILILSPRAVERLETYTPSWPMPKIFRMTAKSKLIEGIFKGETINTPSMLCVEDVLDALMWVKKSGGVSAMIQRACDNFNAFDAFVKTSDWADFLAKEETSRSHSSVCLSIKDKWFLEKTEKEQKDFIKKMVQLLEEEKIAFDCNAYKDAPASLRFWCGATVETSDIQALIPFLDWTYQSVKESF